MSFQSENTIPFQFNRDWLKRERDWVLAALSIQLAGALFAIWYMGAVFTSSDEYCRLNNSVEWSQAPFFAPHDHIWLGGNFWILGSMIVIFRDPLFVGFLHGILGGLLASFFGYSLLRSFAYSPGVSLAGMALFATRPIVMALSKSPQPDILFIAMLFAALLAAQLYFSRRKDQQSPHPWLWGTACVLAMQTLRYEGWFFSVPWGIVTLALFCIALRRGELRRTALFMAAGISLLVFPLLWMESSRRVLGSATAFLDLMRPTLGHDTPELHNALLVDRLIFYPYYTLLHIPALIIPGIWGMAGAFLLRGRACRIAMALLLAFWAVLIVNTARTGFGNNWMYRYAIVGIAPISLFAGPGLASLRHLHPRPLGIGLVVAFLFADFVLMARSMDNLMLSDPPDKDVVSIGRDVRLYTRKDARKEQLAFDVRAIPYYWGNEQWELTAHAGLRVHVFPVGGSEHWSQVLIDPVVRFIVTDDSYDTPGFRTLETHGRFSFRERNGSTPSGAGK